MALKDLLNNAQLADETVIEIAGQKVTLGDARSYFRDEQQRLDSELTNAQTLSRQASELYAQTQQTQQQQYRAPITTQGADDIDAYVKDPVWAPVASRVKKLDTAVSEMRQSYDQRLANAEAIMALRHHQAEFDRYADDLGDGYDLPKALAEANSNNMRDELQWPSIKRLAMSKRQARQSKDNVETIRKTSHEEGVREERERIAASTPSPAGLPGPGNFRSKPNAEITDRRNPFASVIGKAAVDPTIVGRPN